MLIPHKQIFQYVVMANLAIEMATEETGQSLRPLTIVCDGNVFLVKFFDDVIYDSDSFGYTDIQQIMEHIDDQIKEYVESYGAIGKADLPGYKHWEQTDVQATTD
jgi:hypothetical protein